MLSNNGEIHTINFKTQGIMCKRGWKECKRWMIGKRAAKCLLLCIIQPFQDELTLDVITGMGLHKTDKAVVK